jgi:hypothetical protein
MGDAESFRPSRASLRGAAEDAAYLHPDPAKGFHMDGPDEARPDHRGTDPGDARHASANPHSSVRPI